jgi:hypothetical protein
MHFDFKKLLAWRFEDIEHVYSSRDTILYAIGVGCGSDPVDDSELHLVYEERLQALPTMAVYRRPFGEHDVRTSAQKRGEHTAAGQCRACVE